MLKMYARLTYGISIVVAAAIAGVVFGWVVPAVSAKPGVPSQVVSSQAFAIGGLAEPIEGETESGAALGTRVTLSADGNMALVSSPSGIEPNNAWVFVRSGSSWSQQGPRLALTFRPGGYGASSTLSADGNTALIGGNQTMTAFVYTRRGGEWYYEGEMPAGGLYCGFSTALSADGRTAAVGCPGLGSNGAVEMFVREPGGWELQATLSSYYEGGGETPEAQFGRAVALSADGSTLLATAPLDSERTGAAWIFTRSGTNWTRTTGKLVPAGAEPGESVGESVALSGDGTTAIIGAEGARDDTGAAWIFAKSGSGWIQQSPTFAPPAADGVAQFGFSVALSADGDVAVVGGPSASHIGAVWTYNRTGSEWAESGEEFRGGAQTYDRFGMSVSISGEGRTVAIGEPGWEENAGRALAYLTTSEPPPTIKKVSPKKAPAAGGMSITISGTGFFEPTGVKFGDVSAQSFTATSQNSITAAVPPGTAGPTSITVTTPWGVTATSTKAFKYERPTVTSLSPPSGPRAGGTEVIVLGTGFAGGTGTSVLFGKAPSPTVACDSTNECTAVAPPATKAGEVDVVVQADNLKSKKTPTDRYRFE